MMKKIMLCLFGVMVLSVLTMRALNGQPPPVARTCKSGDCTFTLDSVMKIREFIKENEEKAYLVVKIRVESVSEVICFRYTPKCLRAVDNAGTQLFPVNNDRPKPKFMTPETPMPREIGRLLGWRSGTPLELTLTMPDSGATEISELKGTVGVTLSQGKGEIRIDDPMKCKGRTYEKEGVRVTLKSIRLVDDRIELGIEGETDMHVTPKVFLIDSQNKERALEISLGKHTVNITGPNTFVLSGRVDGVTSPPQAIVFRFPVGREEKEIPFEFHDIPLP